MTPPRGPAPLYDAEQARRDLDWLAHVGALRSVDVDPDGEFVVELPTRKLLALQASQVPAFRQGVLAGWRLPRAAP